ncbi:MAG: Zn-dependent alcohol dehydrogenase [Candidatus Lambdaproteobacteria bacterium]|nr:Zn-dependent alcohol dehydrogenase [Candidatus Lambdaproteobacteria bacterium]
MRMKAAVLYEPRKPLVVEEVELDPPRAGEALVKMVATGVCHSDIHYYTGDQKRQLPVVLGHEGAGIVEKVGEGVTTVKPGDHVVLTFLPSCGKCHWCHTGQPNMCDLGAKLRAGFMIDGTTRMHRAKDGLDLHHFLFVSTYAQYSIVPEASMVVVPDWLPLERLCLFGCGFTTGFGAATNAAHIRPGETVTIVGCGGLGLAAVQGAKLSGAGKIIAVDVHEEKLTLARKFGATHTIVNRHNVDEVFKEIQEITWGVGTDYSMEFVGFDQSDETLDIAFRAIRKGGTMLMVGVGALSKKTLPISPADLTHWRKRIHGVLFGDAQFRTDIPRYVDMYHKGQINLDDMVTQEMRLEDINTAFENVLAGNKVARQVIRF